MQELVSTQVKLQQELLTEEVQEVINYRPHWVVRRGNTFFFIIIMAVVAMAFFIEYPDVIKSSARVVAVNPPKLVNTKVAGKLAQLFIKDGQQIVQGQQLGYIENTADYEQVIRLQNWINQVIEDMREMKYEKLSGNTLPVLTDLGELQGQYQQFQNQWEIIKQTFASGYYQQKKSALQKDLQYLAGLRRNSGHQKQLQLQDQQLQLKEFEAYQSLANDKVIAPLELNQYKSKLLAKEQTVEQLNAQITTSDISSHNKQKEILDLEKQVIDERQLFNSSLLELKSSIELWLQKYVVIAPESGTISFISSLQENELLENGQALFYVEPGHSTYFVEIMAGQKGIGKINAKQKVIIRVEGYPDDEFGYLKGVVSEISRIPSSTDSFRVKVLLPDGLKTSYGQTIFFRNALSAKGEIITDNRKLIDRFAGQLKKIVNR
jgi:HlyD family secretion protein